MTKTQRTNINGRFVRVVPTGSGPFGYFARVEHQNGKLIAETAVFPFSGSAGAAGEDLARTDR